MAARDFFGADSNRRHILASGHVVPDSSRCVQCGICSYNCPIDIDVRAYVWRGESIEHSECLTCGECVKRCPRGVLRFRQTDLFEGKSA